MAILKCVSFPDPELKIVRSNRITDVHPRELGTVMKILSVLLLESFPRLFVIFDRYKINSRL